jgi:hypothetical protein
MYPIRATCLAVHAARCPAPPIQVPGEHDLVAGSTFVLITGGDPGSDINQMVSFVRASMR